MTHNTGKIIEDLVLGPEQIAGLTALQQRYVPQGFAAVVVRNGVHDTTINSGPIPKTLFSPFKPSEIYWVDIRYRQLTVTSVNELLMSDPLPVPIDLSVVLTYRVVDPGAIAFRIEKPVAFLYHLTLSVVRKIIGMMSFRDFADSARMENEIFQELTKQTSHEIPSILIMAADIVHIGIKRRVYQHMSEKDSFQRTTVEAQLLLKLIEIVESNLTQDFRAQFESLETTNDVFSDEFGQLFGSGTRKQKTSKAVNNSLVYAVAQIVHPTPATVFYINQRIVLDAGIRSRIPLGFRSHPFVLPDSKEVFEFEIAIFAEGMEITSLWIQPFIFKIDEESKLLEFELVAKQVGVQQIRVEYYYERHWLAKIEFEVEVVEAKELAPVSNFQ